MSRTLRLHSRLLFMCLMIAAVDVSCSYSSRGRSRRAVHEQGSYLGAESPRSWRPLYNPYTLPPSLSPSQPVPRIVQPDQAQMVFSPRPEVQPGTKNVVANQREGSPDGDESEPPNSQSSKFPSSSVPSKTVHYRTYPSSGLGSPIVPRTWGSSETFYSIKNPVIQSSHVATSSFQPARDIFGSPVVEYNPIPAQQAENPVSNNEKSKYRTFLSSYLFGGSQPTSSTSETPHKGPSEGMKTISGHGATSATQSEGNPSVHGSGRSTHVQGGYGYIGSQSYPTSFKSSNGRQAPVHPPTLSQSASSKVDATSEAQHVSSITKPFHHSANFSQSGGSPSSYSPGEKADTQAKSAFSRIQPLIRFGSFWNTIAPTATQPTQSPFEPAERVTAPHSPAPDQSLKTKSSYVPWKKHGLRSSSSVQNGGATGGYKPGRSMDVNTLGGFQYEDPETTLAPIVSKDDIRSVAIRPSVNTNTAKSQGTGWRNSHVTHRGMKMGSVSGYPAVYKKYSFAPRLRVASTTTSSAPSDTLAPRMFKSGPQEVQLMSIEDDLASDSLHASSNVQSSSEVQTTTNMPRSTPRAGRPWFRRYTPSKDNNAKTDHVSKGFQPAPTQLQSPQSESLNCIQPTSSLPSNNDFHDSLTAGEPKPGPTSSAPFKPDARFNMFESVIYRRLKGSRSKQNEGVLGIKLPGETRPSGSHVSAPAEIQPTSITTTASQSQNVHSIETSQSSDSFHKTVDDSSYEDPKSPPHDSESNEMASNPFRFISGKLPKSQNSYAFMGFQKPISKARSTQDKDADLSAQTVPPTSKEHPPPVAPTSAPSVHPSPPRVQVQPDPSTTELPEGRKPTSTVVKGKRVKGKRVKGQNRFSPSNDNTSSSNDTASRPAKPHPMRFKAIQFADILGSASFSGIQPRGSSRQSVQSTSNTAASGQDGGALDKDQPTPRGLESPQGKGGDPKAVRFPPFPSDASQSEEVDVSSVIWEVQSGGRELQ
ncbi:mucin-12 [Coregonus clupeaformis]|uniref:mucin-12 n=1 Tax=Coregonus clupeaformis TaxID=59861 RepID=UPI001E1C78AA|nr:mucin-12 [Coregonus clupeaformis]